MWGKCVIPCINISILQVIEPKVRGEKKNERVRWNEMNEKRWRRRQRRGWELHLWFFFVFYNKTIKSNQNITHGNISWSLNHKFKLLGELVLWHGFKSQCDKRSQVRLSITSHLKWNIQCLCASTLLAQWAFVWGGVLEYITYFRASTIW